MSKLYNSLTETSLRMILLLNEIPEPVSVEKATFLDLATVYSADFGIGKKNIHGDGTYSFAEFTTKRKQISEAIKYLVALGFVRVESSVNGFCYSLTEAGSNAFNSLAGKYKDEYLNYKQLAISRLFSFKDEEVSGIINKKASEIIPRRYDEQFLC